MEKKNPSAMDLYVMIRVCDWIRLLSLASDWQLFCIGCFSRFIISLALVSVFYLVSFFTVLKTDNFFFRDNSFLLWKEQRLAPLCMWDGVHFFSIAEEGYNMENKVAFLPGFPFAVKVISVLTTKMFPFFNYLFPVVFYVTLMNLIIAGLTLVLLRKLTILSFLGPLGLKFYRSSQFNWRKCSLWASQTGSMFDTPLLTLEPSDYISGKDRTKSYFFSPSSSHQLRSTRGNNFDDRLPQRNKKEDAIKSAIKRCAEATDEHRSDMDVLIGAVCFSWLCSYTSLYVSVAYTEALHGFFSMVAIYLMCCNHEKIPGISKENIHDELPKLQERLWDLYCNHKNFDEALESHLLKTSSASDPALCPGVSKTFLSSHDRRRVKVQFSQQWFSKEELVSVVILFLVCTIRSNTFLYAGFFWYPIFTQLFYPSLHRRRVLEWYAPQWITATREEGTAEFRQKRAKHVAYNHKTDTTTVMLSGVHRLDGKLSLPRILVLVVFSALLFAPYFCVNYIGWTTFGSMWGEQEKVLYGTSLLNFYTFVQHRFWNVGLFLSLRWDNLPHILLPLPLVTMCAAGVHYVLCSDLPTIFSTLQKTYLYAHPQKRSLRNKLKRELIVVFLYTQRILSSSTTVLLLLHISIAFLVMNTNVLSRFVMGLPSVHWMIGSFIAKCPTHPIARAVPFIFLFYNFLGISLFSLNYDWT